MQPTHDIGTGSQPVTIWESPALRYTIAIAGTLFLYDSILIFPDEVKYIWPLSNRSSSKGVFLVQRYFGLLAQIVMASQLFSQTDDWCTPQWSQRNHILRATSGTVLLISLQFHLGLRAYCLCLRDRFMAWFLASLFILQLVGAPVRITLAANTNTDGLAKGPLCFKRVRKSDLIMAASGWLPLHMITLTITLRRFMLGLREGWGRVPFVFNGVRDDVALFSLIFAFWVLGPAIVPNNVVYFYMLHSSFLSIFPIVCCRLILNSQKLKSDFPDAHTVIGGDHECGNVSTVISGFGI